MIPAHDEELVIAHILDALPDVDYPREKLRVVPVNDRSTDRTQEILEIYAAKSARASCRQPSPRTASTSRPR
ncbi:MAG TPA: glycosyltransferase [Gemmatimonadaceae bacterium]|nr:glycosyltransferase [Gemmatimonadaceae bacterium]